MTTEGWGVELVIGAFCGIFESELRRECPMGEVCQLGGVAIVSVTHPTETGKRTKMRVECDCPVLNCPAAVVYGVAGELAIKKAKESGLIADGFLDE